MTAPSEVEIAAAARAMQESRAWPLVFAAGSARYLAQVALAAATEARMHAAGDRLKRCTICGFVVDLGFRAEMPAKGRRT